MKQEHATLLSAFAPHPDVSLLRVSAPAIAQMAQPGHYVMARITPGWDPFVRESLFLMSVERQEGVITLWVPGGTAEREQLRTMPIGTPLDLLGALGRPLARRPNLRNILLVAEGLALGPLLAMAESALQAEQQVALLGVVPEGTEPYPSEALPVELEYQRAPRGSAAAAAGDLLRWADTVFAAGSQPFYRDLRDEIQKARPGQRGSFAFGLLLEPFGWHPPLWGRSQVICATAACRTCLIELRREKRLACVDGPAFDLWGL